MNVEGVNTCLHAVRHITMDDDAANAFKELYEEIDKLLYQPIGVPIVKNLEAVKSDSMNSALVLKDEDIDELIEYSKKFVEKTKNEIGFPKSKQLQEHGVQCARSERKSNKKLNTPPRWINGGKDKESAGTNCATAIRIIKRIPKPQIKVNLLFSQTNFIMGCNQ